MEIQVTLILGTLLTMQLELLLELDRLVTFLSTNKNDQAVYFSRDAGVTWSMIRRGSHVYEIGDHGGIIVMAKDFEPTNTIIYSWDEGISWQEYAISDININVKNILIEPNSASSSFILYGEKPQDGKNLGIVLHLDFSNLHQPQCRNPENPGASNSDYENWSPSDISGRYCLLGAKTQILRKKTRKQML